MEGGELLATPTTGVRASQGVLSEGKVSSSGIRVRVETGGDRMKVPVNGHQKSTAELGRINAWRHLIAPPGLRSEAKPAKWSQAQIR